MKLVALAVIAAALVVPSALASPVKLVGTVGPGFNITLTQGGKKVSKLKAGQYVIVVTDKSDIHNFKLTGPGVSKSTSVGAKGTFSWNVTLKKGTYKYVCVPHSGFMKGSFTVT